MSKLSRLGYFISILSLFIFLGARYVVGTWINLFYFPLGFFIVFFVISTLLSAKNIFRYLMLKPTRHGLSLGLFLFFAFLVLFSVNYIGHRYDRALDLSPNSLNSLSESSIKILNKIVNPVDILVFYFGEQDPSLGLKVDPLLDRYRRQNSQLHIKWVDAFTHPDLARKFFKDNKNSSKRSYEVFLDGSLKQIHVDYPLSETSLTKGLVQLTDAKKVKIYAIQGHGEIDLYNTGNEGGSEFFKMLQSFSIEIEPLDLSFVNSIPEDADSIVILGPKHSYLEQELALLQNYFANGGRLFLAIDPDLSHNLSILAQSLGARFKNNIIVDPSSAIGQAVVVSQGVPYGTSFGKTLHQVRVAMPFASEVEPNSEKKESLLVEPLLVSSVNSVGLKDLQPQETQIQPRSYSMGVVTTSRTKLNDDKVQDPRKVSRSIVIGDSDFLSNKYINYYYNKDFGLDALAFLTNKKDLLDIPTKLSQLSSLQLTQYERMGIFLGGIGFPILLLIGSFVLWFRQRETA